MLFKNLLDDLYTASIDSHMLNMYAIKLIGVAILTQLVGIGRSYISTFVGNKFFHIAQINISYIQLLKGETMVYDIQMSLYAHIQKLPAHFFKKTS